MFSIKKVFFTVYHITHICAIFKIVAPPYNGDTISGGWQGGRLQSAMGHDEGKGSNSIRPLQAGIDRRTLDWLKKNKNITMLTLEKLCMILDCSPNEVMRFEREATNPQK